MLRYHCFSSITTQYCFHYLKSLSSRGCSLIVICISFMLICSLLKQALSSYEEPFPSIDSMNEMNGQSRQSAYLHQYQDCLMDTLSSIPSRAIYGRLISVMDECRRKYVNLNQLNISPVQNSDEMKYAIAPLIDIQEGEECHIVTLGIGNDVMAETKLRSMFPMACRFSGADPTPDKNKQLFESISGHYFQKVIGAGSGMSMARIFNGEAYREENTTQTDLVTFLKEDVGVKNVVDMLQMDVEGKEFGMLTLFRKEGRLDNNNITLCQFNIEFHWPYRNSLKEFGVFILDILRDGRYVIMKGFYREWRQNIVRYHVMRLYAFNVDSPICKSRYLRNGNNESTV